MGADLHYAQEAWDRGEAAELRKLEGAVRAKDDARLRMVLPELRERDTCTSEHCHHFACKQRRQRERDVEIARTRRAKKLVITRAMREAVGSLRALITLGEPEEVPWEDLGGG